MIPFQQEAKLAPMNIPGYQFSDVICDAGAIKYWSVMNDQYVEPLVLGLFEISSLAADNSAEFFIQTTRKLQALDHAGLATIVDSGEREGRCFVVFNQINGETLLEKHASMSALDKLYVLKRLASLIEELTESDLVSPLDINLSLLSLDSKSSRLVAYVSGATFSSFKLKFQPEFDLRPFCYFSPERFERETNSIPDTIYALGACLYELVSGGPPFQADSYAELVALVKAGNVPELPDGLENFSGIINKSMSSNADYRHKSITSFISELDSIDDESIIQSMLAIPLVHEEIPDDIDHPLKKTDQNAGDSSAITKKTASHMLDVFEHPNVPTKTEEADKEPREAELVEVIEAEPKKPASTRISEDEIKAKQLSAHKGNRTSSVNRRPLPNPSSNEFRPPKRKHAKPRGSRLWATLAVVFILVSSSFALVFVPKGVLPASVDGPAKKIQKLITDVGGLKDMYEYVVGMFSGQQSSESLQAALKDEALDSQVLEQSGPMKLDGKEVERDFQTAELELQSNVNAKQELVVEPIKINQEIIEESGMESPVTTQIETNTISFANLKPLVNELQATPPPTEINANTDIENSDPTVNLEHAGIELSTEQEAEIQRLLKIASTQTDAGELLSPADNNALVTYRTVMDLEQNEPRAVSGVADVRARVTNLIRRHMDSGDYRAADALLVRANVFFGDTDEMTQLGTQLSHLRQ